jgi:hypothetical protein
MAPGCCPCSTGIPISPTATPLLHYLYGDIALKVDTKGYGDRRNLVEVVARVKKVMPDSIVLDRALPVSVSPGWNNASVHVFQVTGAEGPVSLGSEARGKKTGQKQDSLQPHLGLVHRIGSKYTCCPCLAAPGTYYIPQSTFCACKNQPADICGLPSSCIHAHSNSTCLPTRANSNSQRSQASNDH